MKKIFTLFAALFSMGAVMAQTPTIVSTEPQNRNIIIEEFTGINCGYCPDGHATCNTIAATYPNHAWAINIHQGGYAANTYTTQWGNALAQQYSISSYPNATVNRGTSATSTRSVWVEQAAAVQSQVSPVNVAAEGTIDVETRTLTLHIEAYYTSNSASATNLLNVALLQNNVLGSQAGAANFNPTYLLPDGRYRHMHMLRDLITGQWGVEIPATQGTFIDTTIVYTIQTSYGTPNPLPVGALSDLEVVVFITQDHKTILTGNKANLIVNHPEIAQVDVEHNSDCALDYLPVVTVSNGTENAISNVEFEYDGQSFATSKTIQPFATDTFHMPVYTLSLTGGAQHCTATKSVKLVSYMVDEESVSINNVNPLDINLFDFNVYSVEGPIDITFNFDGYAEEAKIDFKKQADCNVLYSKQFAQRNNNKSYKVIISPAQPGYYIFNVYDSYGDGMSSGAKGVTLTDATGNAFWSAKGNYGKQAFCWMDVTNAGSGQVGIDNVAAVDFNVYPNPAFNQLYINCNEAVREVSVLDMAGRTVISNGAEKTLNVSGLATGVYMVRVATENGIGIQKFVKE